LGLIGHLEAQRALSAVLPVIAPLVREPLPALEDMSGFVPVTDIAMMRHALRPLRLFSN
jgi:urease accessory protein